MCDCIAFLDENGCWFAKNSDREPDEPQRVEWHDNCVGNGLQKTTYIEVVVPEKRFATWLSRPDWMLGAEMGVNEQGVAIGNEAVFTRLINRKTSKLLGMDLLRLALEQSNSADQALSVITSYLQKYGQGGAAGYRDKSFFYDNSFLIIDAKGGWQLETAGNFWVAKKLNRNNRSITISNDLSIGSDFDCYSDSLMDKAKKAGYWNGKGDFNFKKVFSTWFMPWVGHAQKRQSSNLQKINTLDKTINLAPQIADLLRQHKMGKIHSSNADVCMHATGRLRPSQTTQSMICHLSDSGFKTWMTAGSAPCISLFKPILKPVSDWLLQQPNFWEDWYSVYRETEANKQFKNKLQKYNQQIEAQLWYLDENEVSPLLEKWWQQVKNF